MRSDHQRIGNEAGDAEQIGTAGNGARRVAAPICLLDDDPSVLKATGRLLSAAGWEVNSFSDPHAFLHYAHQHQPPVAVIDVLMPVMNGLEVLTRLRTIAPDSRVFVLTSKDDPGVRAKAMESGAAGFFHKPADGDEFLDRLCAALN